MSNPRNHSSPSIVTHDPSDNFQGKVQAFKLTNICELRAEGRNRDLVKGLIPKVGLTVVYGPPKCGKSFWIIDLLAHIAAGRPYRGRRVHAGPVVYIGLEGEAGLRARAQALAEHLNLEGKVPFDANFGPLNLVKDVEQLINGIKEQCGAQFPVCIAIDTLNRSIAGSENDDRDMGAFVRACDRIRIAFGCAVVVIHHTGKEANGPRGHSSLTGAADAQISVRRGEGSKVIVASIERMKDGEEGDEIVSRLEVVAVGNDEDGDPITTCVVVPAGADQSRGGPKLSSAAQAMFGELMVLTREAGEPVSQGGVPDDVSAVLRTDLIDRTKQLLGKVGQKPDTVRTRQKRALDELERAGLIARTEDFVWLAGHGGQ